ncbi:YchJ family protein [Amycolatopsis jejuensis]|uniref:YchJ family protein n=1 Tax=Amycolatopsis jejuensis TaxID=330084 RepID=UPI0005252AE2|nr:YchJ family protein [Amycolatopsis jejuensis]
MANPCPCGLPEPYPACCGRFHRGGQHAPTAERLMRSRYSAFVVGEPDYLLATWHPSTRPTRLELDPARKWTRLEIAGSTGGSLLENEGTVEFRAHHRDGVQHENSRFVREGGRWYYVDAL